MGKGLRGNARALQGNARSLFLGGWGVGNPSFSSYIAVEPEPFTVANEPYYRELPWYQYYGPPPCVIDQLGLIWPLEPNVAVPSWLVDERIRERGMPDFECAYVPPGQGLKNWLCRVMNYCWEW